METTTIEDIQKTLESFEVDLEKELLTGTDNPWLARFTTRVAMLRWIADVMVGYEDIDMLRERIEALLKKKDEVARQYGYEPPDEIKQELMQGVKRLLTPEANTPNS